MKANKFVLGAVFTLGVLLLLDGCETTSSTVVETKFSWTIEGQRSSYEGEVKDGLPNGQGTSYWANGDRYEGEFKDGKFNGQGTLYFAYGHRYEGEFKDGIIHGQGTFYSKNGNVYRGKWIHNQPGGGWLQRPNSTKEWVTDWWF